MNLFETVLENSLYELNVHKKLDTIFENFINGKQISLDSLLLSDFDNNISEGILDKIKSYFERSAAPIDIKSIWSKLSSEQQQLLRSEIASQDKSARLNNQLAIASSRVKDAFKSELASIANNLLDKQDSSSVTGRNMRTVIAALYSKLLPTIDKWQPSLQTQGSNRPVFDATSTIGGLNLMKPSANSKSTTRPPSTTRSPSLSFGYKPTNVSSSSGANEFDL